MGGPTKVLQVYSVESGSSIKEIEAHTDELGDGRLSFVLSSHQELKIPLKGIHAVKMQNHFGKTLWPPQKYFQKIVPNTRTSLAKVFCVRCHILSPKKNWKPRSSNFPPK